MMLLLKSLNMGDYGAYVYSAYTIVFVTLIALWLTPWLRWRKYLKQLRDQDDKLSHE